MNKKIEILALLVENGVLRGMKFAPRGREGWARGTHGTWPVKTRPLAPEEEPEAAPPAAEEALPGDPTLTLSVPETPPDTGEVVMEDDKPLTRALSAARTAMGTRQVVLGLSLAQVLVRVLKLPIEVREDILAAVTLQMNKLSPFPGEELAVGCEVVNEDEDHLWVLAAILPETVYAELGHALDAARLQTVRTDIATLGWLRSLSAPCNLMQPGRRVLLMNPDDGWDLVILDGGVPVLMRHLGHHEEVEDFGRDLRLSLLQAELEAGAQNLHEILLVSQKVPSTTLMAKLRAAAGCEVRHMVPPAADGGVEGVGWRTGEGALLDLTPQPWRDAIKAARFRKNLLTFVGVAVAVWLIFMGSMFAAPFVYNQMTSRQRALSRAHYREYKAVADTRERVRLIESYTDRSRSPLEMLRMTSLNLPSGVTLVGFTYKREDGVKISGEADQPTLVYEFKDAITDEPVFDVVNLTGPALSKGKHKFDIDAKFFLTEQQP